MRIALSVSPSVQCASASSRRASGCCGRSVITRQKQATASSRRFRLYEQDAEVRVGVDVLRIEPDGRPVRRLGLDRLVRRPQQHAEIAVSIGVGRIEDNRALIGFDRFVEQPRLLENDAEVAVPVRRIGRERQALPMSSTPSLLRPH